MEKKYFFNNAWEEVTILGSGSFGTVYKVKKCNSSLEIYSAVKQIKIPNDNISLKSLKTEGMTDKNITDEIVKMKDNFLKEIELMYSLKDSSNIVKIEDYEAIEDYDNDAKQKKYIINIRMELLKSIDDYFIQDNITDKEILKMGIDISKALIELENSNIIHRDIKPENIFVNNRKVYKLGDFGEAKIVSQNLNFLSRRGTDKYMAPEIEKNEIAGNTVDMYSLGIVLYRFFNNKRFPFVPDDQLLTVEMREMANYKRLKGEDLPKPINANDDIANVILKMCSYDPKDRYSSAKDLYNDLKEIYDKLESENILFVNNKENDTNIGDMDEGTIPLSLKKFKKRNSKKSETDELLESKVELSKTDNDDVVENNDIKKDDAIRGNDIHKIIEIDRTELENDLEKTISLDQENDLVLTIPKTIKSRQKIFLKGRGELGQNGGENGDLYITVMINENKEPVAEIKKESTNDRKVANPSKLRDLDYDGIVVVSPDEMKKGTTKNICLPNRDKIIVKVDKNTNDLDIIEIAHKGSIKKILVVLSEDTPENINIINKKKYDCSYVITNKEMLNKSNGIINFSYKNFQKIAMFPKNFDKRRVVISRYIDSDGKMKCIKLYLTNGGILHNIRVITEVLILIFSLTTFLCLFEFLTFFAAITIGLPLGYMVYKLIMFIFDKTIYRLRKWD